jgi:PhzF family phenazine biosynthesis protein
MTLPIFQVDAFTDRAFAGNPAAVCILPNPRDEQWMQNVAREMNLSETAFLHREADHFNLHWFAPAVEVDLCGHATLASAHVLWETSRLKSHEQACFHTRSGLLTAGRKGEWIELDFPAQPEEPATAHPDLARSLGVHPKYVGKNQLYVLVEVESDDIVRNMKPDIALLRSIPIKGIIVTAQATTRPYDFVSRFFAPRLGVDEDPVTGSSFCCLGPFWRSRLHRSEFIAHQASKRGGVAHVRFGRERVFIGGQAVTVLRGELAA